MSRALLAGYPDVLGDVVFRRLFLILLLAGSASGMALAYTSVWIASAFGVGPQAVGLAFVIGGAVGAVGNPLIGLASDRTGRRRPYVIGQLLLTSAALLAYPLATTYTQALVLVALSGFGVMGLTLTTVADVVAERGDALATTVAFRIISTQRTAWAMGIIVGPAIAALLVTVTNDVRPVFLGAAALQLVAAGLAATMREPGSHRTRAAGRGATDWPRSRLFALAVLVVGLIFLALPAQTRNMYLPLFITQELGQPFGAVGPAFTINAMTAVLAMPHMGSLAYRIGAQRVLYCAVATGLAYCVLQTFAPSYAATLLIQCLIGLTISLWSTAGLIYLQQLLPGRAGVAGGLYLAVQSLTPVVGGLGLGPLAELFGVRAAFAAAAALLLLALALLGAAHRALVRD